MLFDLAYSMRFSEEVNENYYMCSSFELIKFWLSYLVQQWNIVYAHPQYFRATSIIDADIGKPRRKITS